jgi:hypothetical protein
LFLQPVFFIDQDGAARELLVHFFSSMVKAIDVFANTEGKQRSKMSEG